MLEVFEIFLKGGESCSQYYKKAQHRIVMSEKGVIRNISQIPDSLIFASKKNFTVLNQTLADGFGPFDFRTHLSQTSKLNHGQD